MRRIFFFIAAAALLLLSLPSSGQHLPEGWTTHYNAKFYGFEEPMVFSQMVEKPGMSAEEIYQTIQGRWHPTQSEWLYNNLYPGEKNFGRLEFKSSFKILDLSKNHRFYYDYYIDAHDGYYTVNLTDIHTHTPREIYVCGINGQVFRRQYSLRHYNIAVKMAERAAADFEEICQRIEEEAFGLRLREQ